MSFREVDDDDDDARLKNMAQFSFTTELAFYSPLNSSSKLNAMPFIADNKIPP